MDYTTIGHILAWLLVIAGVAGTVLPVLPGSLMVLAGLWIAAWLDGYAHVGTITLVLLVVITVLTYIVDFLASALGAKRVGASRLAIWGALAGAVVGIFFGLPGILLGPFVGAMAVQYLMERDLLAAGKVGVGAWLGMAVGTAAKLALVFLMIGLYLINRFI